ncbi:MAG: hypothetical protein HY784_19190 [Chloroflexi bacterium]|nr:hypothetical protein [Chloroflexota bacterium]
MHSLTALLFLGAEGPGPLEAQVAAVRAAAAVDAVHTLAGLEPVERVILVTSERGWAEQRPDLPVTWDFDPPGLRFHFGQRLADVIQRHRPDRVLYLGAGSLPLLPASALLQALQTVGGAAGPTAVTNNLHSSDWIACNHAARLLALAGRLPLDNALGWVLQEAGYAVHALPPSAATRLDIDTPADILALGLQPDLTPELGRAAAAFLAAHPVACARYRSAARTLFRPGSQVILAGRVGSAAWAYLEKHTQVWIRVFSEERGMSASGRQAAGAVRSLLAELLAQLGEGGFFSMLATLGDAVFLDSRVILAHHRRWPCVADRYASDLGLFDEIHDDLLRRLTCAAVEAPLPVVLGGHGVVAGGLYALVAAARSGVFNGA